MATLLEIAEQRDLPHLVEVLDSVDTKSVKRGDISVSAQLIREALYYAKAGDADEAILRLRLRARPKFWSIDDCKRQYKIAMAKKRARPDQ